MLRCGVIIIETVLLLLLCVQVQQEKFDFFPLNRALSLSAMDEDSTESKVDDLLRQVNMLVERQREEVSDRPTVIAISASTLRLQKSQDLVTKIPRLYFKKYQALASTCNMSL